MISSIYDKLVTLTLAYVDLLERYNALEASTRREAAGARQAPVIPPTPTTDEAEVFARQVPKGSKVRDVTSETGTDITDALEQAAQALQKRRIPRDAPAEE